MYWAESVNGRLILKSGSDYKNLSVMDITEAQNEEEKLESENLLLEDETVETDKEYLYTVSNKYIVRLTKKDITFDVEPNDKVQAMVEKCDRQMQKAYGRVSFSP